MNNLFSVEGKVVLITGGSGGIGSVLVREFTNAKAKVCSMDKDLPSSQAHVEGCYYLKVDLSTFQNIKTAFSNFYEHFRRVDVLINCAAITAPFDSIDYPDVLWEATMKINLDAVFFLCKFVGHEMIKQQSGGSIINFTSINAQQAMPNNPAYAAAKSGVRQLTKALAFDWGRYNIRVNNLGPGYTKTSMNKNSLNDLEAFTLRSNNSMLGRWANPLEMVGPAIFLASEASSFVTGTDLWVDGGWLSKGM